MWHYNCVVDGPGRLRLKCDGTRAETRFRLSTQRTSPFKSAGSSIQSTMAAEVCASAVVMLDTSCSAVVWCVLDTHSIRQFPLHFPSRTSPCAITFQLGSTNLELFIFCTQCVYRYLSRHVNMLALLMLCNRVHVDIIYRKWLYVV